MHAGAPIERGGVIVGNPRPPAAAGALPPSPGQPFRHMSPTGAGFQPRTRRRKPVPDSDWNPTGAILADAMSAAALDTLSVARDLEAAGIERGHAEAIAKAVHHGDERAATKADLDQLRAATKADIDQLRADIDQLRAAFEQHRAATKADLDQLRAATRADLDAAIAALRASTRADLDTAITSLKADMLKVAIGIVVGVVIANATLTAILVFGALQLLRP